MVFEGNDFGESLCNNSFNVHFSWFIVMSNLFSRIIEVVNSLVIVDFGALSTKLCSD